jgi:hypothetical protein
MAPCRHRYDRSNPWLFSFQLKTKAAPCHNREHCKKSGHDCNGALGCSAFSVSRSNRQRVQPRCSSPSVNSTLNATIRHEDSDDETRMAGLDAAAANAQAPTRPAAPHAWRDGQPARGTRDLPWFKPISHSWVERARYNRSRRVVWLHSDDQPGHRLYLSDRVKMGTKVVVLQ